LTVLTVTGTTLTGAVDREYSGVSVLRMSDLERLIEIVRGLPPKEIQESINFLEDRRNPGKPVSAEDFQRILDCAPEEDADEQTAVELREALREGGPSLTLDEMKREIGIA